MNSSSAFFDIPRFLSAFSEWGAAVSLCAFLPRRDGRRVFIIKAAFFLVLQTAFMELTGDLPLVFWIPCMSAAVIFMGVFVYSSYSLTKVAAFHFTMTAFMTAEFAASLEWQMEYFFLGFPPGETAFRIANVLIVNGIVFLSGVFFSRSLNRGFFASITWREAVSVFLIAIMAFTFSNISFLDARTPFSVQFERDIFILRTMVDLAGVAVMYAYQSRMGELIMEKETAVMNTVLSAQYDQYRTYQQGIELVNIKYHDLKHQIAGLRAEMDPEKREEWLSRLEDELEVYRPETQTDNAVLDTLIAGKTAVMRKNRIKFTCVVDGQILSAIHVTDICSIFGNALDNAIESVVQEPDPEKRLIHLTVTERSGFIFIMMSNYCSRELDEKEGFPVTTKTDQRNHGYGLRSIRYAAGKYGGSVTCRLENSYFELKILIPLKQGGGK
ncbi:MAG: GHKL domain-containing protein [Lachnospiraceae bacterium]|nr:GHKL domain-containing protein [Lachnospiraceae bacterium]